MNDLTIGIAGTAKNTGKTTTLAALMKELKQVEGLSLALTSIGYDGEYFDTVTGLPKPRISVERGHVVAIAEQCAIYNTAKLETICETDIVTPMGRVVVSRVTGAGKVVLAGPNNRRELRKTIDLLRELGAGLIIVDGALSRIAPMTEVDGLILATGASKNPDVERLTKETGCMTDLLSTPALEAGGEAAVFASILNQAGAEEFAQKCATATTLVIQGIVGEVFFRRLEASPGILTGKRLLFADPTKLLLAGEVTTTHRVLRELREASVEIGVVKPIRTVAVTVNPYYPQYRYSNNDYQAAYVDKKLLLDSISGVVGIPCFDVVQQGGGGILQLLRQFGQTD